MSNRTIVLDDLLYQYLLDNSLRETDVMRRLRAATARLAGAAMQISPEQGQFMSLLVELIDARHIIELGTFTGYSALRMASAMPADGELVSCDISAEWTGIAADYWREAGVDDRIHLHLGPAIETLDMLIASGRIGQFDLAFVDADKTGYPVYYERCLQLLRTGGLLLFDNTLWGGAVADPTDRGRDTVALRELNRTLHSDQRVSISMLPIGDGLTLARKRPAA